MLCVGGCVLGPLEAELTASACGDMEDNDGDTRVDCEDPDCQGLEVCREPTSMLRPALPPGLIGETLEPGASPATGAAEAGTGAAASEADSPQPAGLDAGHEPPGEQQAADGSDAGTQGDKPAAPSMCPLECPAGQTCVSGRCLPNPLVAVDLWDVTTIEVNVPRSIDYANDVCLDDGCPLPVGAAPYRRCGCLPDPFVIILVDGEEVGRTTPRPRSDFTRWTVSMQLRLLHSSVITLTVMDDDTDGEGGGEEPIYTCVVDASPETLAAGTIGCTRPFTSDMGQLSYMLSATVVPGG